MASRISPQIAEHELESFRTLLIRYAYAICGTVADAEDLVQDLFISLLDKNLSGVTDRRAYLIRSIVNRAIDRKKAMQKTLHAYPGSWLPEPLADDAADDRLLQRENLSYALMVLLENLDARQRAVFILREAFAYTHEEIAAVLNLSVALSRQLLSRAKKQLQQIRQAEERMASRRFLERYLQVVSSGNTEALELMLLEDITIISDGGGKARAAINPIYGLRGAMGLLLGVHRKFGPQYAVEYGMVNGAPALIYLEAGKPIKCTLITETGGRISRVYIIRNPDKLANLRW